MSTHSTVARRRRATAARKRANKEQWPGSLRLAATADIEAALYWLHRLLSRLPSRAVVRRYLAASVTLVAALTALAIMTMQTAVAALREGAATLLSKVKSVSEVRRREVQRQLVYVGQAAATWRTSDGMRNAAGTLPKATGRMPAAASWRLVLVERMSRIVRPDSPFEWNEYDWRRSFWGRRLRVWPGVLAGFVLLVLVLALAFILATRATNSAQARLHPPGGNTGTAAPSGIIVEQPAGAGTPTPPAVLYQIGAWVSDSTPSGGSVKVFVRVSSQTKPVPNVPVTISVDGGGGAYSLGPTRTDADGLAIFTVTAGGGRGQPVFVTASAVVGGQTLTHQTTFFPQ